MNRPDNFTATLQDPIGEKRPISKTVLALVIDKIRQEVLCFRSAGSVAGSSRPVDATGKCEKGFAESERPS